jgi:hypothetical protein
VSWVYQVTLVKLSQILRWEDRASPWWHQGCFSRTTASSPSRQGAAPLIQFIPSGPFYGGPYHPIPVLEKDRYERIRRLRLIVYHHYHHNLHMWYRVVCISGMGGIKVLLDVLSWWHKWNIWFLHFSCFFISIWWYGQFLKTKRKFSFQVSKNKKFKFFKNEKFQNFHFEFSWHISIFQISIQISKSIFSNFSISYGQIF